MGSAVTRPTDLIKGTISRVGVQVNPLQRSERVSDSEVTVR
jgi:hypothetical protein